MLINVCRQPAAFINVSQLRLRKFIHFLGICGVLWGCETSKHCSFPISGSRKAISQSTICVKRSDLAARVGHGTETSKSLWGWGQSEGAFPGGDDSSCDSRDGSTRYEGEWLAGMEVAAGTEARGKTSREGAGTQISQALLEGPGQGRAW